MKKLIVIIAALVISGCEVEPYQKTQMRKAEHIAKYDVYWINTKGMECVVFEDQREGGISCNWDRYNQLREIQEFRRLRDDNQ